MRVKVKKLDYHRNGISGEGFHVALFSFTDGEDKGANMVGVVFEGAGQCAVFDVDMLKDNNIEFAHGNSWRGDHFEPSLRSAIRRKRRSQ